ncbi:unnamed protein product [Caenorhabditis brenneri]
MVRDIIDMRFNQNWKVIQPWEPLSSFSEGLDHIMIKDFKLKNPEKYETLLTRRLEFLDDGYGMSRREMLEVISFGHSDKMTIDIGRYGNGMKAGAFYLGQEIMVLTKKDKRKLPKSD